MPASAVDLLTDSCQEFCRALKAARESQGITLSQISNATKIPADLFAALERSDLRRWPKGLFRRSFFRDYAKSIGLPVEEASATFARLFPDETSPAAPPIEATPAPAERPSLETQLRQGVAAIAAACTRALGEIRQMSGWLRREQPAAEQAPMRQHEPGEWVSDARRVGSPRIRIRIKVPR
ncbi:MAG TPA: helix-turn-helix transcriptional regulator [Vicinamibacterales bacterium]|nr:helix-turn-helix transcriptional regulator [Vicinamibacterales bacterium]